MGGAIGVFYLLQRKERTFLYSIGSVIENFGNTFVASR